MLIIFVALVRSFIRRIVFAEQAVAPGLTRERSPGHSSPISLSPVPFTARFFSKNCSSYIPPKLPLVFTLHDALRYIGRDRDTTFTLEEVIGASSFYRKCPFKRLYKCVDAATARRGTVCMQRGFAVAYLLQRQDSRAFLYCYYKLARESQCLP